MSEIVCYCWGYTDQDIRSDALENGTSTILQQIIANKRTGVCNCVNINPKGR